MYEVARRHYEESFADPDDPDDPSSVGGPNHHLSSTGAYSYGHGQLMGSDGFTLSGHFVGIEQLSLNDTFIGATPVSPTHNGHHHTHNHTHHNGHNGHNHNGGGSVTGMLSNIKAFQINGNGHANGNGRGMAKTEVSEEDMREAMEQSMLQGIPN